MLGVMPQFADGTGAGAIGGTGVTGGMTPIGGIIGGIGAIGGTTGGHGAIGGAIGGQPHGGVGAIGGITGGIGAIGGIGVTGGTGTIGGTGATGGRWCPSQEHPQTYVTSAHPSRLFTRTGTHPFCSRPVTMILAPFDTVNMMFPLGVDLILSAPPLVQTRAHMNSPSKCVL